MGIKVKNYSIKNPWQVMDIIAPEPESETPPLSHQVAKLEAERDSAMDELAAIRATLIVNLQRGIFGNVDIDVDKEKSTQNIMIKILEQLIRPANRPVTQAVANSAGVG